MSRKRFPPDAKKSSGLALIAVLWLVAAMGLIITGVVKSVKTETISSGQQRQFFQAKTQADALILLALQNLFFQPDPFGQANQSARYVFAGQTLNVQISPLNGLIDINNAPPELLTQLYAVASGLPKQTAQALSQATIQTRETTNSQGLQAKFDASEDLLQVPGMTYDHYVNIKKLVTADLKDGSGRINPLAAPLGVLTVLTGGDAVAAAVLYDNRNVPLTGMDTTALNPAFIETRVSNSIRLSVNMPMTNGGTLARNWDVLGIQDQRTGLPWRVLGKNHSLHHNSTAEN